MNYGTKILPSGISIENRPHRLRDGDEKYRWYIKDTFTLHNEEEPTIIFNNEDKYWIQHHKFHRLDGPAIEFKDGRKKYYIDNSSYDEEVYWNHSDVKKYMYLKEHPELKAFV